MALHRKRDPEQPRFSATTPHFVKIIPAKSSTDTKLVNARIPKRFVRNYGQNLRNPIGLKLPSGDEWEVEVTECDGEVWFDKGWLEFSEFYSLEYGDLLVFRYEGNSIFHVCIFDKSATEIDYPIRSPDEEEESDEDGSVDILASFPPCPKSRGKSRLPSPLSRKRKIMSTSSRVHPLTEDEKTIALQRADGFESKKPHFKVALQPSYLRQLVLPLQFVKKHLCEQHSGNINLRVSDGGTWPVYFKYDQRRARFRQGWSEFVGDNSLEVGDVCVFIKIEDVKLSFQVIFYHESWEKSPLTCPLPHKKKKISTTSIIKAQSNPSRTLTEDEKAIALQRADGFESDKPHFKVILQPSYICKAFLVLPSAFAKKHLTEQPAGNIMLKVSNVGTWPVYFKYAAKARFQHGWTEFVRDNNLEVGDVCVFILIEDFKLSFQVVFYRTTEAANCPLSPAGKCKMGNINAEQATQNASNPSSRALKAANKFISHNPFF